MKTLKIKPRKSGKLAHQLYEQLLDLIISGILQEGDKLPSENELCRSFQVSRPIVREAINKLKLDELVFTEQGRGSFVLNSPLKDLRKFATANELASILESHEVRTALEGETAALAAKRRSPEQLEMIRESLEAMKLDFQAGRLSIEPDFDFHVGVARATNNDIFVRLLEDLHIGLKKTMAIAQSLSRLSVTNATDPNRNLVVIDEHQKILDAIMLQDEESARFAMRYHISSIKQRLINAQGHKP